MRTLQIIHSHRKKATKRISNFRNHQTNYSKHNEHRYRRRRNVSFHGKYGKNEYLKSKSHSLNAILEELYTFGPEDFAQEEENKIKFGTGGPLIPRIKLKRSTSSLKEEKTYKTLCKMSSESEIIIGDSTNSSLNDLLKKDNTDINPNRYENNITILLNDQSFDEISSKSDENYFTKNFDDCMKRLQQIEKEHELIENEDKDLQFCVIQNEKEEIQKDAAEPVLNYKSEYEFDNYENESTEKKHINLERGSHRNENDENDDDDMENCLKQKSAPTENITKQTKENGTFAVENKQPVPTSWYSSLKQQFKKTESENQEPKTKEMTCRITGATLKNNQSEKSKSEDKEKDTRHYFSRLVKTNKSLIDEELPDPDKVKHIRSMFQETLNSTLKRKLDKKLGGSLQNISSRATEQQMSRPLSAQCYRNDLFCEAQNNQKTDEEKEKTMKEISRPLRDGNGEFQIESAKKKLFEKYERDLKPGKEYRCKKILQPKWTDTGSVSSGISSDLSSYDTDLESYSREGTEQDEMTVSDDDLLEELKDKHYVQNEVLEKIRSFGTSVTYYGGEMITCSVGPLLSPTTQAIMEEISEKYGSETSPVRSFDEFYRKYIETNEHNRKKKVGRTRSFGQNDVFQKPNVLNNTEIELYKNDLEIEIGIKKPAGIPQNTLKRKVTKSASLGSKIETPEKPKEKCPEILISPTESDTNFNSAKENSSEKNSLTECDIINKNVTDEISTVTNPNSETKVTEATENYTDKSESKETENKSGVAAQELPKPAFEKERFYLRSVSAPEGVSASKNTSKQCESDSNNTESPAKEIYFSYERSIFNKKRNSDMEFEEFEVCESLTEKLEKLEKRNSVEKTSTISDSITNTTADGELQKSFENNSDEKIDLGLAINESKTAETKEIQEIQITDPETEIYVKNENSQSEKKDSTYNYTKWPIETSVMVDIQKNSEQTPKIISTGKTVAKTKIRLF